MASARPYSRRDLATKLGERTIAEFFDDRCPHFAASIAYRVLFSLFPLAIVLTAVFSIVIRLTGVRGDVVDAIVRTMPLSGSGADSMRRLLEGATSDLSALGLVALLGLVWSASGMMAAVRTALDAAWDVENPRPFLKGKLIDVGLVFAAAAGALASLGITVAVRVFSSTGRVHAGIDLQAGWVSWLFGIVAPLLYAFVVGFLLYRFLPPAPVATRHAWPAALGVACLFVAAQNLFALYVQNFSNYNAVYGSLGAVIAFMLFVYVASSIFLLGAELTSEWPRAEAALRHGGGEDGPPLGTQAKQFLRGLWVREPGAQRGDG